MKNFLKLPTLAEYYHSGKITGFTVPSALEHETDIAINFAQIIDLWNRSEIEISDWVMKIGAAKASVVNLLFDDQINVSRRIKLLKKLIKEEYSGDEQIIIIKAIGVFEKLNSVRNLFVHCLWGSPRGLARTVLVVPQKSRNAYKAKSIEYHNDTSMNKVIPEYNDFYADVYVLNKSQMGVIKQIFLQMHGVLNGVNACRNINVDCTERVSRKLKKIEEMLQEIPTLST